MSKRDFIMVRCSTEFKQAIKDLTAERSLVATTSISQIVLNAILEKEPEMVHRIDAIKRGEAFVKA
jgi:hypothetical protein